ncbi:MAG TPA: DUF2851 family protein, partial [Planctomycetaceae bacterium]|nr:DUF2851 family protein [Planctomycetaceae bacterium]
IKEKGTRNYDAGPDIVNALIVINGEMKRGDVEIHSLAGDWFIHGHSEDPRYNNVILHVVTMQCSERFKTVRQDGQVVPVLNLDSYLVKPAEQLEIESENEAHTADDDVVCALAMQEQSSIQKILSEAGEARLRQKADRYLERRDLDSWDQICYQSVLVALGYSKNQIPFARLARLLPVETVWKYVWNDPPEIGLKKCEAYLFGTAGLLPDPGSLLAAGMSEERAYLSDLWLFWSQFPEKEKMNTLKPEAWKFFRLRPDNFPTRRIAAAATIVMRFMDDGFVAASLRVLSECDRQPHNAARELQKLFIVQGNGFWSTHYSFDDSLQERSWSGSKQKKIVGAERARDIAVNVVLPAMLAYSEEIDDGHLRNIVREVYSFHPFLSENDLTRAMRKRLFGSERSGAKVITGVKQQQGMIHLKKLLCHSGHCNRCLLYS